MRRAGGALSIARAALPAQVRGPIWQLGTRPPPENVLVERERDVTQETQALDLQNDGIAGLQALERAAQRRQRHDPLAVHRMNHVAGHETAAVGVERAGGRRDDDHP